MVSEWAKKQQKILKGIKIEGVRIEVSHLGKTLYLPKSVVPSRKVRRDEILTYPDGLVKDKTGGIIGVVEIVGTKYLDPKQLAGDIFATDVALGKEKNKVLKPFLIVAVKRHEDKQNLKDVLDYANARCEHLKGNISLCEVTQLENTIKEKVGNL